LFSTDRLPIVQARQRKAAVTGWRIGPHLGRFSLRHRRLSGRGPGRAASTANRLGWRPIPSRSNGSPLGFPMYRPRNSGHRAGGLPRKLRVLCDELAGSQHRLKRAPSLPRRPLLSLFL